MSQVLTRLPFCWEYAILRETKAERPLFPTLSIRQGGSETMKLLKALLAFFTLLAVALTGVLLFVQDKRAPRYVQIYTDEQ